MTLRAMVCCDSNPAPYAGGADWPCRAWLTCNATDPVDALADAARAGWSVDLTTTVGGVNSYLLTCPACTRAQAHPAQEARP